MDKKIAIFHNSLDNIGGAEIVDLILAREINADIYTTNINKKMIKKMGYKEVLPRIFSIGKVPLNAPLRQELINWKFRKLDLKNKYDFYFIAGDWAMSSAINNKPNLWYVFSPTREIWDLKDFIRKIDVPWYLNWLFDLWVLVRRFLFKKDIKHVGKIISTSNNVQERMKKYFHLNSKIIYPPVETSKFRYKKNGDFWLSVNRLIDHKRVNIQLRAFSRLPNEKLLIVGSYEKSRHFRKHANKIKKMSPKNVEILSWVDEKKLIDLYANCKGFITTAKNEDLGMTPIEAMASGKPVIAPNEGGYKETIIDGKTGILIDNINPDKLVDAIKIISKNPFKYKKECEKQAKKFDTKIFIEEIKKEIGI